MNLCCALRYLRQTSERLRVLHGDICQDLSIQFHSSLFQTVDEAIVGQAVLSRRRVDARDPQTPQIASSLSPVSIGIPLGLHPGFVSPAKQFMARRVIPFGLTDDLLMTITSSGSSLDSHSTTFPSLSDMGPDDSLAAAHLLTLPQACHHIDAWHACSSYDAGETCPAWCAPASLCRLSSGGSAWTLTYGS